MMIYRFRGDEFAIFITRSMDSSDIIETAITIQNWVSEPNNRIKTVMDLKEGIKNREFYLMYQPIVVWC
jgi:sensor c-di-GMP phosphodiesterase-like protein